MTKRTLWVAGIGIALGGGIAPGGEAQEPGRIRWEDHAVELGGKTVEGAQLGRLVVPEKREEPNRRTVELAFVRLPGRVAGGTPTIYLDGGPGGSGIGVLEIPGWARLLDGLRNAGDVVLLSQRGTGLSRPRLVCGPAGEIPAEAFASREAVLTALGSSIDRCVDQWRDRVDLGAFNTRESARDVDAVRRALGAERMNLLGFSYGTHLALAVLRQHGAAVARAVLAGTEGPGDTYKLPSTLDTQLRTLSTLVSRDSSTADDFPDLYAALDTLLSELDREPRLVELADGSRVTLSGDGLRYLLRLDLGDTNDLPLLPALLQDARSEQAPLLGGLANRRFSGVQRGVQLMGLAMNCASGASAARMQRIRREWSETLLGEMSETLYPDVCDRIPVSPLDEAFRSPVRSEVPTLFVSGTLDANTPPHQAEQVRWGFPNSAHLIVENAGHESTLTVPAVQDAIVRFLTTGEAESGFLRLPPLDFLDRREALERLRRR